ncbi:MAG: universal stress protein [Dermatophilaceae bacterium]
MTDNKSKGESTPRGDHVVVGIDGADPAHAALLWAAAEADQRGVALHIVNVKELRSGQLPLGAAMAEVGEIVAENSGALLDEAVAAVKAAHPGVKVVQVPVEGQASRKLVKASKNAALVVVGSHGKHKGPHAAVGTTAFTTAVHAHCPVVVVHPNRKTAHPSGPATVVVGVDGSRRSARALDFAIQAARPGGTVKAVYAWWFDFAEGESIAGGDEVIEARIRHQHNEKVAAFVAEAAAAHPDVTVQALAAEGSPVHVLDAAAKDADLLVVGSRGKGGFGGLLLGSTAMKSLIGSPVPVALTHR